MQSLIFGKVMKLSIKHKTNKYGETGKFETYTIKEKLETDFANQI